MAIEDVVTVKDGICTGRNGTFDISGIEILKFGNTIRLDCISKKKNIVLNAGLSMDMDAAEKLVEQLKKIIAYNG